MSVLPAIIREPEERHDDDAVLQQKGRTFAPGHGYSPNGIGEKRAAVRSLDRTIAAKSPGVDHLAIRSVHCIALRKRSRLGRGQ